MKDEGKENFPSTACRLPPTRRLIIFDLGRVLMRICDSWRHACEVAGITVKTDWPVLDAAEQERLAEVIQAFDTGRIELNAFAERAAQLRGLSAEQVIAINNGYLLGPYDGVGELVDELNAAGHGTACLSNTNANHWRMLSDPADRHGRVISRLGRQFASHLMGVRKPDPVIYERVEKETGIGPDRIVFFDDLPENIAAAQQRGWTAHLVEICENPIPMIRERLRQEGVL